VAQLRQFQAELEAHNTRVAIISFGSITLAQKWIEETKATFQFLLDPERKAYQAFGLDHSLSRSWSPKVWIEYARLMAQGRKWRGIQGDSGQLGGDFIVDSGGILRLAYRSNDPADRPTVSYLLKRLDDLNGYHSGEVKTITDPKGEI
jgi:alkyl hydroperoxide reductase subunit AhpC